MKNIKKLLFILTVSAFLLISFSAFASENTNSIEVLKALNIGEFSNASHKVTRGEFAKAISDILSYNNRPESCDGIFRDVKAENEHSGAIYDLFSRGYISGYAGGSFGADDPILYEQAVKIAVSVLGYDTQAKSRGGYPTGYIMTANSIDLLEGVNAGEDGTLLCGDAARLIENAMNSLLLHQTSYGSEDASFEAIEGITLLSYYAKIARVEGILYDNGISSLVGNSTVSQDVIKIGSYSYKTNGLSAEKYLGYKVCAYVSCGRNKDQSLIYIKPAKDIKTLQITAKRLDYSNPEFSASNILYYDVYDKQARAKILPTADFIYNGKANPDLVTDDLKIDFGKLILIDNNQDNVYDVIHVEEAEIFPVTYVDSDYEIIYKSDGSPLDLKLAKRVEIQKDGIKAELSDIKSLDIVSAKVSLDKEVVILDVSSNRIISVVEGISTTTKTITLNGKVYSFINDYLFDYMKIGNTYEFCLDTDGYIAHIVNGSVTGQVVGFVVDAIGSQGLEGRSQVRIFTTREKFEEFFISPKAKLDGLERANQLAYIESKMKYELVAYTLNSLGEVSSMELPFASVPSSHQTEDSFRQDYWADHWKWKEHGIAEPGSLYCYTSVKNFKGFFVPAAKAKVFVIPYPLDSYDSYKITDKSYFSTSYSYQVCAYSIGKEDGYSDYITVKYKVLDENTITESSYGNPMVVAKITTKADADGNASECIVGYDRYGQQTVYSKAPGYFTSLGVKQGDIIQCVEDMSDRVVKARIIVDGHSKEQLIGLNAAFNAEPRMTLYNVYARYGSVVECTTDDLSSDFDETSLEIIKQTITTGHVYEVDTTNNRYEVKKVSYNTIKDYKNTGKSYSKLFVHAHSGSDALHVIYK